MTCGLKCHLVSLCVYILWWLKVTPTSLARTRIYVRGTHVYMRVCAKYSIQTCKIFSSGSCLVAWNMPWRNSEVLIEWTDRSYKGEQNHVNVKHILADTEDFTVGAVVTTRVNSRNYTGMVLDLL